jgi:pSer/pThr/pTyr-binding forkhead associated (FHA) protein
MARLVCLSGMNKGEEYDLPEQGELSIGRGGKNDICVYDRKSSRNHCKIYVEGAMVLLEDLQSTNGVRVNDQLVVGQRQLNIGDQMAIGQTVFLLSEGFSAEAAASGTTSLMKKQRKCENLIQKTSFPATKTTALRKIKAEKEGGDTGFLSFFETGSGK